MIIKAMLTNIDATTNSNKVLTDGEYDRYYCS